VLLAKEEQQFHLMAVDKTNLRQWLGWLEDAGIKAHRLLADVLALPINEQGWSALQLGDAWLIRQNRWQGMLLATEWLNPLLQQWQDIQPVIAYAQTEQIPLGWQKEHGEGLSVLAAQAFSSLPDLLTGEFKVKKRASKRRIGYFAAAACLLLTGVFFLLNTALQGYQQQKRAEALQQQASLLYQQMFPGENKKTNNLRASVQKQLKKLQTYAIEPGLLSLLNDAAPLFNQLNNLQIDSIHYDANKNTLALQLSVTDLAPLKNFSAKPAIPFEVQVIDQQKIDSRIKANIILREKT
jgi:general secretion pathway protein L